MISTAPEFSDLQATLVVIPESSILSRTTATGFILSHIVNVLRTEIKYEPSGKSLKSGEL